MDVLPFHSKVLTFSHQLPNSYLYPQLSEPAYQPIFEQRLLFTRNMLYSPREFASAIQYRVF